MALGQAATAEVRHRDSALPPTSIFRWWARRTDAVSGAIIDAMSSAFHRSLVVADPFAGGGVIPLAAFRRGHTIYAQDINSWATRGLEVMLDLPDPASLTSAFEALSESLETTMSELYQTTMSDGRPSQIAHTLRVGKSSCPHCGWLDRHFPFSMVTLTKRKDRGGNEAYLACRYGHLFLSRLEATQCPVCMEQVDLDAAYTRGRKIECSKCGLESALRDRMTGGDWKWEVVLVHRVSGKDRELGIPHSHEMTRTPPAQDFGSAVRSPIPMGRETNVLRAHGFQNWEDLYPELQFTVLRNIVGEIDALSLEPKVRKALTVMAIGAAETPGYASRWDRWYLKNYELGAAHRFEVTTLTVEPNVWGVGRFGRGSMKNRFRMLLRAARWLRGDRSETNAKFTYAKVGRLINPRDRNVDVIITTGSSDQILLKNRSVDLVLTDPPYYTDLQYQDLAAPFQALLRSCSKEVVPEVDSSPALERLSTASSFGNHLGTVFKECRRIVTRDGRVILSFANRNPNAWFGLLIAMRKSRLHPVGFLIVETENSNDYGKRGTKNLNRSLFMELSRSNTPFRQRFSPQPHEKDMETKLLFAIGDAFLRVDLNWSNSMTRLNSVLAVNPLTRGRRAEIRTWPDPIERVQIKDR